MRLLQVNDVHTCDRAPKWRTGDYNDQIFDKLRDVTNIARRFNARDTVVVFTGDLFHTPQPSKVSHALVNRWLEYITDLTCYVQHVLIIKGNHDCISEVLDNRAPIAALAHVDDVTVLSEPGWWVSGTGVKIGCFPWSHNATAGDVRKLMFADAIFLHGAVAQEPNPFYSTLLASELDGVARVVGYGHLHPPEQPYHAKGSHPWPPPATLFVNPGALSRGSLTPSDLERTPQVAVIDILAQESIEARVEYVPLLSARPASEIFRVEEAHLQKQERRAIQQFVESLGGASLEALTPELLAAEAERAAGGDNKLAGVVLDIFRSVE